MGDHLGDADGSHNVTFSGNSKSQENVKIEIMDDDVDDGADLEGDNQIGVVRKPCSFNPHTKCCCMAYWNLRRYNFVAGVLEIFWVINDVRFLVYIAQFPDFYISIEYNAYLIVILSILVALHIAAGSFLMAAAKLRRKSFCLIHCCLASLIVLLYIAVIAFHLIGVHELAKNRYWDDLTIGVSYTYSFVWFIKMAWFGYDVVCSAALYTQFRSGNMYEHIPICSFGCGGPTPGSPDWEEKPQNPRLPKDRRLANQYEETSPGF